MADLYPYSFPKLIKHKNFKIAYQDIYELVQSGPETGKLLINEHEYFADTFFGGPLLIHDDFIFIPVLVSSWLSKGFKLGKINLHSFSLEFCSKKEPLILIEKVTNGELLYYTDLQNTIVKKITLK